MAASWFGPLGRGAYGSGGVGVVGSTAGRPGVLAATASGLKTGIRAFIVPRENETEAAILAPGRFAAVETLRDAVYAMERYAETGRLDESPRTEGPSEGQNSQTNEKMGEIFPRSGEMDGTNGPWKLPPPGGITSSYSGPRAREKPCSPGVFLPSWPPLRSMRRWKPHGSIV